MPRGKKIIDYCALCGKEEKLSFEHVPPQSTGNKGNIQLSNFVDELDNIDNPHFIRKYGKIYQNGVGYKSLCESCNKTTGSWYGSDYKSWKQQIEKIRKENPDNSSELPETTITFFPLRVLKQVLSMFISVNRGKFKTNDFEKMKNFILSKNSQRFPTNIHIYFFVLTKDSPFEKQTPIYAMWPYSILDKAAYTFSEITWGGLGYILTLDEIKLYDNKYIDINFFSKYTYDQEISQDFVFPLKRNDLINLY
ncbi:MAG: hypothetical protein JXM74_10405 [Fusobacteriaceae bacterium]|nr:hypothetical protein [Fusobacteriaceae bacterium]MBN2839153.1 hypothetical protein [Fusobacteriaceae bacterium]